MLVGPSVVPSAGRRPVSRKEARDANEDRPEGVRRLHRRGKLDARYSSLGFNDTANLDDGDLWPVSLGLKGWSPAVEKKVVQLVKAAVS